MNHYAPESFKVIRDHLRLLISDDLFFFWYRFVIKLKCLNLFWHWLTQYSQLYDTPKIFVSINPLLVFELTFKVIGWP